MKVPIEEIARFIKEGWPQPADDWYLEESEQGFMAHLTEDFAVKEPGTLVDSKEFQSGLVYQGRSGDDPTHGEGYSFVGLFQKWRKAQTTVTLVIEVSKDKETFVRNSITTAGGKVMN